MKLIPTLLSLFFFVQLGCAQTKIVQDTLAIDDFEMISTTLPKELKEISTLAYENRDKSVVSFWGLNDSGNKAEIYRFTKDGKVLQTLTIANANNIDWEEITLDENHLYIGDFGNNLGKRKDLAIYKINRNEIDLSLTKQRLTAEKIEFFYPEQTTFGYKNLTTNWDAEAFFVYNNNKIHILTKEWSNQAITHYSIPIDSSEKHAAKKLESFPTNYMVTGAHLSVRSKDSGLYLIGYTKETIAVLQWFELPLNSDDLIFSNSNKTIILPLGFTTRLGQLEGISLSSTVKNQICFSGEEFNYKGYQASQVLHCIKNFTN